jgi:hypothetical protein
MSEVPKKVKCSRCGWTPKPNGDLDDTEKRLWRDKTMSETETHR